MKQWLYLVAVLFWGFFSASGVYAQDEIVEATYRGENVDLSQASARQELFREAIQKVSMDYIYEIIGEQKANKNRELIRGKILKDSGKYVLSIKSDSPVQTTAGTANIDVILKLSLKNLRAILLEEGLLYQSDGPPAVLPMISLVDRVNSKTLSWWTVEGSQESGFLADQLESLHRHLKTDLRDNGFFGMSPVDKNFAQMIPRVFKTESPRTEDIMFIGEWMKAAIVIRGHVRLSAAEKMSDTYKVDIKLEALHSSNGRVIGEVIRSYETETGPFQIVTQKKMSEVSEQISKDLAVQLFDAWKRGTLGAALLRLTLRGSLNYQQLEQFKKTIISQVRDIKSLRERMFEPSSITFEVDASSSAKQLAEEITRQKFARFKVEVSNVKSDGLDLSVKAW